MLEWGGYNGDGDSSRNTTRKRNWETAKESSFSFPYDRVKCSTVRNDVLARVMQKWQVSFYPSALASNGSV